MASQTAKPAELDIEYAGMCPECKAAGQDGVALGFSFEQGGIVCKTGQHKFNSLPGDEPVKREEPAAEMVMQQVSIFPDTPEPAPLPAEIGHVQVKDPRELANGDIQITLRIPDRHAAAVKGEAEVQRQTLEEYLQTWIEYALDNQWGR